MINEETLVKESIKNNKIAQRTLYEKYANAMYNTCIRMMGNEDEAKDVLQDAFIKAFTNLQSYSFEASFGAWLKRIVVNTCLNQLRKNQQLEYTEEDTHQIAEEVSEDDDLWKIELIQKAMPKLATGYRQILTLYLFEGYNHKEIGQILDIRASISKSQYHRAKKELKNIINTLGHEER